MLVKPAKGLSIRDPDLQDLLPAKGREVPRTDYWLRRLADGDVREVEAKAPRKAKPEAEPAAVGSADPVVDAALSAEPVGEADPAESAEDPA